MKHLLLCPPTYYDIEYEINPWMHLENKVDHTAAQKEYEALKAAYLSLPVEVYEIPAEPGLPDMIYSANFGQVCGDKFISSNFKHPERRREAEFAAAWFKKQFGFSTYRLPDGIFFEGQGDLLNTPRNYFLGWGKRTSPDAIKFLAQVLDKPIIDFELVDPYYYHLDMSLAPLSDELAVVKPESFTAAGLEKIYNHFSKVIVPSALDQKIMACNMVRAGDTIVIAEGISDKLKNDFAGCGLAVREIPMNEYRKGGGSVKCSTFEF